MSSNTYNDNENQYSIAPHKRKNRYIVHLLLFCITFITCMIAGTQWAGKDSTEAANWHYGLQYAILLLTFLGAHEFGHYFASKYHKVDATLPFFIPAVFPGMENFGTFGAVIRTRTPILTRRALFDIGFAGPAAGFVVSLAFLIYGLATLPPINFIYTVHPEYITQLHGKVPAKGFFFGSTLLWEGASRIFSNPRGWLPPLNEIYHYPFLNAGWFGLFVTALNLLPFGQLDGGHIARAMFGNVQRVIARAGIYILLAIGGISLLAVLRELLSENYSSTFIMYLQDTLLPLLSRLDSAVPWLMKAWPGWLLWALIGRFFVKPAHPPVFDESPLGIGRMILGCIAGLMLILSFSYEGAYFIQ